MTQQPSTPIQTVDIRGKQYVPVAERVRLVHESGRDFEMIESEAVQYGADWIWRCTILIDGKQFRGSAQVHLNARAGSADAADAWACAETSAIGRAMGFANFGNLESIASADEVLQATTSSTTTTTTTAGKPVGLPPNRERMTTIFRQGKEKGIFTDPAAFIGWINSVLVKEPALVGNQIYALSDGDMKTLASWMAGEKKREEEAAA